MSELHKHVTIYTDGGCEPNPGSGGYGVVLIYGEHRKQTSGGFRQTTNNRMELMAAIKGLELLKEPCIVTLVSDSEYLVKAMNEGWARRWQTNGWKRYRGAKAANYDLWEQLLALCDTHSVTFQWVRGHSGQIENELCDRLSMTALRQPNLPPDEGYVAALPAPTSGEGQVSPRENAPHQKKKPVEGGPCPACGAPLARRTPKGKLKENQRYYFEYYLYCPTCTRIFMVEEAKRTVELPGLFD